MKDQEARDRVERVAKRVDHLEYQFLDPRISELRFKLTKLQQNFDALLNLLQIGIEDRPASPAKAVAFRKGGPECGSSTSKG